MHQNYCHSLNGFSYMENKSNLFMTYWFRYSSKCNSLEDKRLQFKQYACTRFTTNLHHTVCRPRHQDLVYTDICIMYDGETNCRICLTQTCFTFISKKYFLLLAATKMNCLKPWYSFFYEHTVCMINCT